MRWWPAGYTISAGKQLDRRGPEVGAFSRRGGTLRQKGEGPDMKATSVRQASRTKPGAESRFPFRVHARAIAALGRDLVTDDVVAVMELVKNSYDALATRVDVKIRPGRDLFSEHEYIEVSDDGHGMDHDTVRDAWCVIATPSRTDRPFAKAGDRVRAVTGEKGLGRLAAARLGDDIRVRTRQAAGPVFEFSLNWSDLFRAEDIGDAGIRLSTLPDESFDRAHGTSIRITSLRSKWQGEKIDALGRDLARLVSPFGPQDFAIRLDAPGRDGTADMREIRLPRYMSEPKYSMAGKVDADGTIHWRYRHRPVGGAGGREEARVDDGAGNGEAGLPCGPFEFEIRAWDLSADDTRDMAEHYRETRSRIRGVIREHRGISLYRDDVLVLPKSERARDWLGLDLRRVSRVGTRLSTSQVVGYVRIGRVDNPGIVDTSDRERLVANPASEAFLASILRVVEILENERDTDRTKERKHLSAKDLFADLTVEPLLSQVQAIHEEGGNVEDAIAAIHGFAPRLERAREDIERRFGYYNRMAVVGTIAQIVIHEIRNQTTVIGRGLKKAAAVAAKVGDEALGRAVDLAAQSAKTLDALAERFAPLARRAYRPGRRMSVLEEAIDRCCEMLGPELRSHRVAVEKKLEAGTRVRIDPAELDTVILNLMTNSLYWMSRKRGKHRLRFRAAPGPADGRVTVSVDDTGPGVDVRDRELVFRPGWTRKPGGIGMGLVVASEMVEDRAGGMQTIVPGELGGATFAFDLPLVDSGGSGDSR